MTPFPLVAQWVAVRQARNLKDYAACESAEGLFLRSFLASTDPSEMWLVLNSLPGSADGSLIWANKRGLFSDLVALCAYQIDERGALPTPIQGISMSCLREINVKAVCECTDPPLMAIPDAITLYTSLFLSAESRARGYPTGTPLSEKDRIRANRILAEVMHSRFPESFVRRLMEDAC